MTREDLPHIQFYIGDWRRDVGVQSLSYHHRGIWLELLMLMHCSEQRGKLVLNGKPMSDASVARLLGLTPQEGTAAIAVLLESAVASRDDSGSLICRRMVRDELKRAGNTERVHRYREKKRNGNGVVTPNDNGSGIGNESVVVEKKKKARACSIEEVVAFCQELDLPRSDGEWFWHKCEGNGWANGGKAMRDWRATLRSWKAAGYVPSIKNPVGRAGSTSFGPTAKPMSVFEIDKRIEAINDEINRLFRDPKNHVKEARRYESDRKMKTLLPEPEATIHGLIDRRNTLKKKKLE